MCTKENGTQRSEGKRKNYSYLSPQNFRRLNHPLDFFECVLFIVDASFGEAAEAAIGIEKNLFGRIKFKRLFNFTDDELNGFDLIRPGIDNAQAEFLMVKGFPDNFDFASPWCGILQNKLAYIHFGESRKQW